MVTFDKYEALLTDSRSNHELVELAVCADRDDLPYSDYIDTLRLRISDDVIAIAKQLCSSQINKRRLIGIDILLRVGEMAGLAYQAVTQELQSDDSEQHAHGIRRKALLDEQRPLIPGYTREAIEILLPMLDSEDSDGILPDVIMVIANFTDDDPRILDKLLQFVHHPNPYVRFALTRSFGDEDRSIQALITLSSDEEVEIRDWASFGLSIHIKSNTPEILDALYQRLDDEDEIVRGEALRGLATHGDRRVVELLLHPAALDVPNDLLWQAMQEAFDIDDPRLRPTLQALLAEYQQKDAALLTPGEERARQAIECALEEE
jgi:HEAT repeat protein